MPSIFFRMGFSSLYHSRLNIFNCGNIIVFKNLFLCSFSTLNVCFASLRYLLIFSEVAFLTEIPSVNPKITSNPNRSSEQSFICPRN